MALRDFIGNDLHDRVIKKTVEYLNSVSYDIYTNPGQIKNAGINGNYPDIVMTQKGTNTVKFIIEVETADSINLNETINQWKKYAAEINATFYLLVPQKSKNIAQTLCNQVGISVRFATFTENQIGGITISFE